ncbi:MAG TPA: hypothetical protein DFR83_05740 [Deltaproteobacteria bacterium]|nr:hypothetical protein [Deltaproteobacteria bacterium]
MVYTWTAPSSDIYSFDLYGSAFDTGLYILDASCAAELQCNDDYNGYQSALSLNVAAGSTYQIVVDGFDSDEGNYVLSIYRGGLPSRDSGAASRDTGDRFQGPAGDVSTIAASIVFAVCFLLTTLRTGRRREEEERRTSEL